MSDDQDNSSSGFVTTRPFGEDLHGTWGALATLSCALSLIAYVFQSKALVTYGEMYHAVFQKVFSIIAR
ncbi:MAG TPA: hypothetical protein PKW52_15200 [Nitrospira sp.]|nr:hypothetical protein [Nitrospira sp. NTP1]HQR14305.1 hypothetical protein [Nitrospira sp.]HQV12687.1 hypothetical protein [Nitrospira sp.]